VLYRVTPLLFLLAATACGHSGRSDATPVAALSSSQASEEAFRTLRQRWVAAANAADRARLVPLLVSFLSRFPGDGQADVARVYLAIVALDRGDLAGARSLVASLLDGPPGTARDLAEVVEASAVDRAGQPAAALERLEPLVGKLIDPYARAFFDEELVRAALGARHWYEAVAYMDVWLRDTSEEDLDMVRGRIDEALARVPSDALELMFQTMTSSPAGAGYGEQIEHAVGARLTAVALHDRDADLAQRLLKKGEGSVARSDASEGLYELASIGGAARVDGRTVGLLVSVQSEADRVRSGDMLAGVMEGLGLLEHPEKGIDSVRLTTREEKDAKYIESAVAALATQGASVLLLALAPEQSAAALKSAERLGVAAVALTLADGVRSPNSFFIGEDESRVAAALFRELLVHGVRRVAPVGAAAPPGMDPRALVDGVSCEAAPLRAGEPRFPLSAWRDGNVDALLLLGDVGCARDALAEARAGKLRIRALAFGLDAANLVSETSEGVPLLVASAGAFPWQREQKAAPLGGFESRHGAPPSWSSVLGHDAAILARTALRVLPDGATEDQAEVQRRRAAARAALEKTTGQPLWSTDSGGFRGEHKLARSISVAVVQ
jgi:hypothetical protein